MNGSPSQVRLLVMVLVGWCALSAAPVVANSPALPAAFFVIAVGLVAAITLRFSTLAGLVMAVLGTALFAVSMVMDPATAAARGGVQGVTGTFTRLDQLVPALVAAVSLVGVAVCASLASWEIDGRPGAIQDAARRAGAGEEGQDLEEERVAGRPAGREEAARPYVGVATAEHRPADSAARSEAPPAAPEEPAATRAVGSDRAPGAEPPAPTEEPAAAAEADRGVSPEAVAAQVPAAEEAPAAPGGPPRDGGPAAASDQSVVEPTPKVEEPAPSGEPASVEEQPAAPPVASEAQAERREGAVEAAPAESAPPAGEVKGEEIAAREIEEKNGRTDSGRQEAARPDWRHRRRPDDDVARRLPRRRKR
ncbi:MAG: hypothetical protein JF924_12110 [Candidatus Dormibacteraeota bacterium]|nr:hypothetical protein [Candidatus Dormibacteraeota bacterium]